VYGYIDVTVTKRTKILANLGCDMDKIFFLCDSGLPQYRYKLVGIFRKMYRLIFSIRTSVNFRKYCYDSKTDF